MTTRALFVPYVVEPRDQETVCLKTPVETPNSYLETTLTPDEAEILGLNLMIDARRAKDMLAINARIRARAKSTISPARPATESGTSG